MIEFRTVSAAAVQMQIENDAPKNYSSPQGPVSINNDITNLQKKKNNATFV